MIVKTGFQIRSWGAWLLAVYFFSGASIGWAAGLLDIGAPDDAATQWQICEGEPPGCEFAVIWLDKDSGALGAYVRAPKSYFFRRASHTATERVIVLRGRITAGVDDGGDGMLTPGMYWNIPGSLVHWMRCEDACLMYIEFDKPFDRVFH
ncbi:MAG TPA: DUF4437 domain-containing protein [Burkholderiales bacterium]|nr:DUF4437 domain-containing protein [Burkholderiales bacterium]